MFKSEAMECCENKYKKIFDQGRYSGLLQLSDAKIFTDDGFSFDIHKIVLAKRSDFFRAMFCGFEKGKKMYELSNVSGNILSDILVFIYTKYVDVTETNINDLLIAADFFCVKPPLYSKIKSQVKVNLRNNNCLRLCLTAYQIHDSEIFRWCLNYIAPRFEDIISCHKNDINDFPLELLKSILSNGSLNVKSESTIWQVIVHWVQACPQSRLNHVTSLLSTLAVCEIDPNLAREIVNHEITSNIRALNSISLMNFNPPRNPIKSIFDGFKPNEYRIPQKVSLISENTTRQSVKIYISFDEAVVSWYKICEVPNFLADRVIAVEFKVYLFKKGSPRLARFNLKTMKWKIFANTDHVYILTIFAVKDTLYTVVLDDHIIDKFHIYEYDVEKNRRIRISSLNNYDNAAATAIGEDVFVVTSKYDPDINVTGMLNVVTNQWTVLPSPNEFHGRCKLYPLHNKIYLVVDHKVEVFDPAVNVWKALPDITLPIASRSEIILSDKLIIYSNYSGRSGGMMESKAKFWNENKEYWEVVEKPALPDKMCYDSCSIDDVDLIKFLCRRIRNSKRKIQKSPFNFLY